MRSQTLTLIQPHAGNTVATHLSLGWHDGALPHVFAIGRSTDTPTAPSAEAYGALFPQTLDAGLSISEFPSILPSQAEGWTGMPAIQISRGGVEVFPRLRVTDVIHDASSCTITASDDEAGVSLTAAVGIGDDGLIRLDAALTNLADAPLSVSRLTPVLPLPPQVCEVETCTGHHLRERALQRQPLTEGLFAKDSHMGRPDFNSATLLSAGERGFGFEQGLVFCAHVAWSGNSTVFAERTPYTHGVIGGGELPYAGEITLAKGETYASPTLLVAVGNGLNDASAQYHAYVRAHHPQLAKRPRPVTLNTWEAMYFGQSEEKVIALADRAATIGVERFVIDDGWFLGRRDDTKGLGDWQVDRGVWPNGFTKVAEHVHGLGMEFGVWFEPEMVNPDSNVAREHPDWILAPNDSRLPMEGRSQQVLDLTNPDAAQYIEQSLDALVGEYGIDYIKWDHNRFLTEPLSRRSGLPAVHRQTKAFYAIVDALKARHPGLEIESCSSGGGRIDVGALTHTDRVWASDCTDPIERTDIQRGTSLIVPPEMLGEHISESPNHATRRATTLTTRAAVAFFGHLGIEWNIMKLSDEGMAQLRRWVELYKARRDAIPAGTVVHVDNPDPAVRVDGLVSPDRSHAVFRFATVASSQEYPYGLTRFAGLDASAVYRVRPVGGTALYEGESSPNCRTTLGWWSDEGIDVPGAALMEWGIRLPQLAPEHCVLVELIRQ